MSEGIVLLGLPGSGKSTVGRCLARRLGRPFVDLDAEIEVRTGRAPAEHIAKDGEAAFRRLESDALSAACALRGAVIATGGGVPLDPLNRWALMAHGLRVRLDAPAELLAARLAADPARRPLLGDDVLAGLRRTAAARAPIYAAVDVVVDAQRQPERVVDDVIAASTSEVAGRLSWRPLYDAPFARHHPIGPQNGRLLIGSRLDARALSVALADFHGRPSLAVVDRQLLRAQPSLVAALPADRTLRIVAGEHAKTLSRLGRLLAWLSDVGAERGDPLLAVGGGTLGDLAGLAAALHRRGMPLVHVPTTWLAQVDSAIGGKVAVDLPRAKNGVGAFWPAWQILADVSLLASLPVTRRRDGLAEALKAALIGDAQLWQLLERRGSAALDGRDEAAAYAITERAARVKLSVVERDPHDRGERQLLNLGHTIGHALEVESRFRLAHGEAVALGLRAVAAIASRRGTGRELAERIDSLLVALSFPLRRRFDRAAVVAALGADKKRDRGVQRWLLPLAIGHVEQVDDVSVAEVDAALDEVWLPA